MVYLHIKNDNIVIIVIRNEWRINDNDPLSPWLAPWLWARAMNMALINLLIAREALKKAN